MPPYERIAVLGVGLIGGSIGLAARQRGLAGEVVGIGRRATSLEAARRRGAVDRTSTEVAAAAGADLVIVATPVELIVPLARQAAAVAPAAILTDAGSTKEGICEALGDDLAKRFVGSHPLAGDHRRGPEHARGDLLVDRTVVVTPTDATPEALAQRIAQFWQALGAKTRVMSPADHDAALAATSHLPHLIAAALASATPEACLPLAATGWADATRIAAGDAALWTQIFAANRDCLLEALDRFDEQLDRLRNALEQRDWQAASDCLQHAQRIRDALGD